VRAGIVLLAYIVVARAVIMATNVPFLAEHGVDVEANPLARLLMASVGVVQVHVACLAACLVVAAIIARIGRSSPAIATAAVIALVVMVTYPLVNDLHVFFAGASIFTDFADVVAAVAGTIALCMAGWWAAGQPTLRF